MVLMRSSPWRQARPAARATASTASAARRLAPAPPSRARTSRERDAHLGRARRVGQQAHRLAGDRLGREVALDQLRHDAAARDQVHHAERVHLHERPEDGVLEPRQAVDDHHRPVVQRRLERGRARRGHHDVGRRQHVVGAALERRDAQPAVEPFRRDRVEHRVVEAGRARHQELDPRHRGRDPARRVGERRQDRRAARSGGCPAAAPPSARRARAPPPAGRPRAAPASGSARRAGGPRTRPGRPRAGRPPPRTGRSPGPSTRAPSSSSCGRRARPRAAGSRSRRPARPAGRAARPGGS